MLLLPSTLYVKCINIARERERERERRLVSRSRPRSTSVNQYGNQEGVHRPSSNLLIVFFPLSFFFIAFVTTTSRSDPSTRWSVCSYSWRVFRFWRAFRCATPSVVILATEVEKKKSRLGHRPLVDSCAGSRLPWQPLTKSTTSSTTTDIVGSTRRNPKLLCSPTVDCWWTETVGLVQSFSDLSDVTLITSCLSLSLFVDLKNFGYPNFTFACSWMTEKKSTDICSAVWSVDGPIIFDTNTTIDYLYWLSQSIGYLW